MSSIKWCVWVSLVAVISACGTRSGGPDGQGECGDGQVDEGTESCDDGNVSDGDGCDSDCHGEDRYCGDGVVDDDLDEDCDDGNQTDGDGCTGCVGETRCNDGVLEGDEECDDGNGLAGDGCSPACTLETSTSCGDGAITVGELCDDGSTDPGDGCSATCVEEAGWECLGEPSECTETMSCGNSVREGDEECDNTDLAGQTCMTLGFSAGTLDCDSSLCELDTSNCSSCGNGMIEGIELCDDDDDDGGDGCSATCQEESGWGCLGEPSECTEDMSCGNSTREGTEECDNTDLAGQTCMTRGYFTGALDCDSLCEFDELNCTNCGNSIIDSGEDCDGTLLAGATCTSLGFNSGTLSCSSECEFAGCFNVTCGNGVIDINEFCDDGDFDAGDGCGATCLVESGYDCTGQPSVCLPDGSTWVLRSDPSAGSASSAKCRVINGSIYIAAGDATGGFVNVIEETGGVPTITRQSIGGNVELTAGITVLPNATQIAAGRNFVGMMVRGWIALRAANGTYVWQIEIANSLNIESFSLANATTIIANYRDIATGRQGLLLLNAATGAVVGQFLSDIPTAFAGNLIFSAPGDGGAVYFANQDTVLRITASGMVAWQKTLTGVTIRSIASTSGGLAVAGLLGANNGFFAELDSTGTVTKQKVLGAGTLSLNAVTQTTTGYSVTGSLVGTGAVIINLDANGTPLSGRSYVDTGGVSVTFLGIGQASDGSIVAGARGSTDRFLGLKTKADLAIPGCADATLGVALGTISVTDGTVVPTTSTYTFTPIVPPATTATAFVGTTSSVSAVDACAP